MALRDDASGAVLRREVGHRPDRVELNLEALREFEKIEYPLVAMNRLGGSVRLDRDDLGQMDLKSRRVRQHLLGRGQHERIHHEIAAGFRTRDQSTGPARAASREIVAADTCRRDVWLQFLRRPIHHGRRRESVDNRGSILGERGGDVVGAGGCGKMSDAHRILLRWSCGFSGRFRQGNAGLVES